MQNNDKNKQILMTEYEDQYGHLITVNISLIKG